jgi:hypothetical protein
MTEFKKAATQTSRRRLLAPRVTITVTRDIIEDAVVRDSSHCMIAQAVRLAVPAAKSISVDLQTIRWSDAELGLRYTYLTPRVAQVALINFDQGRSPKELSFQLRQGQVTRMSTKYKPAKPKTGEGGEGGEQGGGAASKTAASVPTKREFAHGPSNSARPEVPTVIGGRTPPVMTKFARKRTFGLRGLER